MAAGPFDKQGQQYLNARPLYPPDLFKTIAALTSSHAVAWDAGTGNGQAAVGVAEYYENVIATDISNGQLQHAIPHSRVRYLHTPATLSEDELVNAVGGDNSVDLITVATAVHWFDLPKFYAAASRALKKPDGVIVVWGYSHMINVNPEFEARMEEFRVPGVHYWGPGIRYVFEEYRNLPFPFRSIGMGEEGRPLMMTMKRGLSFERWLVAMRTSSAVITAKERGVNLLPEDVVEGFAEAWGGPLDVVRDDVTSNVFLIAGKVNK